MSRAPGPVSHIGYLNAAVDARLAAANGASAMFTGAGGDQLFYEFNRWWPLADYLRLRGLDSGFPSAALDAARLGRVSVWRAVAMALMDRVRPSPTMLAPLRQRPVLGDGIRSWRMQRGRFIHPALQGRTGLPIGKHMQTWALMYPIGYYDPFECERAPELVNPLLSQPLIELCLRMPTYVLTQGGQGRASLRRAFAADVPASIINRRAKGGMEEHIKDVLDRNVSFVRELLVDGELVRRGLVDREVVLALLSDKPTSVAGPMSEIHSLIGVEAWLGRWIGTQGRASA
jgi:asparagine synthase (glutamine-hydrolysing)